MYTRSGSFKVVEEFNYSGLNCMIVDGEYSVNGYVMIPKSHPWASIHPEKIPAMVHGNITFSSLCGSLPFHILGFWIGFDTGHRGDTTKKEVPCDEYDVGSPYEGHMWTVEEVISETKRLAEQASRVLNETVT